MTHHPEVIRDGEEVIVFGRRLDPDGAGVLWRAIERAADDALSARRVRERDEAANAETNRLLAAGWVRGSWPGMMVSVQPGSTYGVRWVGTSPPAYMVDHARLHVQLPGGRVAHVATGGPKCLCGAWLTPSIVLPSDHDLPMCKVYRSKP